MITRILFSLCGALALPALAVSDPLPAVAESPEPRARLVEFFDADWRFLKADAPGAESPPSTMARGGG